MSLEKFESVAAEIRALSVRPSTEELLELYALYKQATAGDNTTENLEDLNEELKSKVAAWESKKGMSEEEAKTAYVEFAKPLIEKYKSE